MSGSTYTVSLFESGKMQSTGGCWPEEARASMKKIAKRLKYQMGYTNIRFHSFEVQNLLAVIDNRQLVNLHQLCKVYPGSDYEPERFPAVRLRIPISKEVSAAPAKVHDAREHLRIKKVPKEEVVTVNVFSTGKISFTGGKSIESIQESLIRVRPYLEMCRMQ
eukprot:Polyplicarium_translucidae@DN2592_c1_g1_i1.p2